MEFNVHCVIPPGDAIVAPAVPDKAFCGTTSKQYSTRKILLTMKLIVLFTLIACLQASSRGHAQAITLSLKNAPLEKVFTEVRKQSRYRFIYAKEDLAGSRPVSIEVSSATIEQVLEISFREQPFSYSVVENHVIIKRKKEVPPRDSIMAVPPITVRGRILNERGEAIEGVSIKIKGTNRGTSSDADGVFELKDVDENAVLVFSGVNVERYELNVQGRTELTTMLKTRVTELGNVSVEINTGYQQLAKERSTGSFVKIDNQLYNQQAGTDVLTRLESITNGLSVSRKISTGGQILIRGLSTINGPKDPLIVIDNFPYEGDIGNINPNDIESVTVLKDAAAASIWGARAGNGVIVLTTKKGRFHQPLSIEANSNITIGQKPDLFYLKNISSSDFIDVEEFLFNKGFYNSRETNSWNRPPLSPVVELLIAKRDGLISAQEADIQINSFRNSDVRNDFNKYLYSTAFNQQYAVSAKAGAENFAWLLSAGYDKNLDPLSAKYDRYNFRSDNTFKPEKDLQFTAGIVFTQSDSREGKPGYGNISTSVGVLPPYTMLADANGKALPVYTQYRKPFIDTIGGGKLLDWKYYPLEEYKYIHNKNSLQDILLNIGMNYRIGKSFNVDIKYQFENQKSANSVLFEENSFYTRNLVNTYSQIDYRNGNITYAIPRGGILDNNAENLKSNNVRGQINFSKKAQRSSIIALAGGEVRNTTRTSNSYRTYGYNENTMTFTNVDYASTHPMLIPAYDTYIPALNDFGRTRDRFISFFANAAYTFLEKYTVTASARRDGSNLFGVKTNNKWNPLWSSGIGWDISKESFYKSNIVPYLKFRATYGYSGNVDQGLPALTTIRYLNNSPYTITPTATFDQFSNPELRPEKMSMLNVGLDFKVGNGRISGSIEGYIKRGTDLYGTAPIDYTAGLGRPSITRNVAKMKGKGFDIEVNTINIDKALRWTTQWNLNGYKDEVLDYYLTSLQGNNFINNGQGVAGLRGRPVYSIFSYKWEGLDPQTGDPMGQFNKQTSKNYTALTRDSIQNLVFNGPAMPTVYGTLGNTLSWKRISLNFRIIYEFGHLFQRPSINYTSLFNQSLGYADFSTRWQQPGDERYTTVPSMIYPANTNRDAFYKGSEVLVSRADNIRLHYINIAYSIDGAASQVVRNAKVYLVINNLGMIWKANKDGINPNYRNGVIPVPVSFAAGIQVVL